MRCTGHGGNAAQFWYGRSRPLRVPVRSEYLDGAAPRLLGDRRSIEPDLGVRAWAGKVQLRAMLPRKTSPLGFGRVVRRLASPRTRVCAEPWERIPRCPREGATGTSKPACREPGGRVVQAGNEARCCFFVDHFAKESSSRGNCGPRLQTECRPPPVCLFHPPAAFADPTRATTGVGA